MPHIATFPDSDDLSGTDYRRYAGHHCTSDDFAHVAEILLTSLLIKEIGLFVFHTVGASSHLNNTEMFFLCVFLNGDIEILLMRSCTSGLLALVGGLQRVIYTKLNTSGFPSF